MSKRRLMLPVAVVAAAVAVMAVAAGVGTAGSSEANASYKLFLIPKFIGIPVFTLNGAGAKAAGKQLGDTVTYNGPTAASATAQVSFINTAVQQGANAIIISGNDPNAVAPALKRAMAKGVKVISYDADVAADARDLYVSPPSAKEIGYAQVEWLGSQFGYKGDIAILSAAATAANQNTWIKYMRELGAPAARGRVLLVGDAAGLVDPLSGDGMYEAFVSARLAADAIVAGDLEGYTAALSAALDRHATASCRWPGTPRPGPCRR